MNFPKIYYPCMFQQHLKTSLKQTTISLAQKHFWNFQRLIYQEVTLQNLHLHRGTADHKVCWSVNFHKLTKTMHCILNMSLSVTLCNRQFMDSLWYMQKCSNSLFIVKSQRIQRYKKSSQAIQVAAGAFSLTFIKIGDYYL